jgi:anti-sigma-K factor RskA
MSSSEMHTLAGAFAVDALSEHERAQFQRHLEECESCSHEVRELRATAAYLGAAMAEEPPVEHKHRVMAEIHVTRQQPPHAVPEPMGRSRARAQVPHWVLGLTAAAAVVGLALAGVFGGIALHAQSQLTAAQQQSARARTQYAPVAELLAAPDAVIAHGESSLGGGGTVVASRSLNKLIFMSSRLPEHPANGIYEAWLISANGPPRSAGLITGGSGEGSLIVAGGLDGANRVALTVEQSGGSPTGRPSLDHLILSLPMPA